MRKLEVGIKYNVPDDFDDAGTEITGTCEITLFDSVADATDNLSEKEVLKLINDKHKINQCNTARLKLKTDNGHIVSRELSPEVKERLKATRRKNQQAIKVLQGLSADKLAELGITL